MEARLSFLQQTKFGFRWEHICRGETCNILKKPFGFYNDNNVVILYSNVTLDCANILNEDSCYIIAIMEGAEMYRNGTKSKMKMVDLWINVFFIILISQGKILLCLLNYFTEEEMKSIINACIASTSLNFTETYRLLFSSRPSQVLKS